MSHDAGRRASCRTTIYILWFHFETPSEARGVTDGGVGSGDLLGLGNIANTSGSTRDRCPPTLRDAKAGATLEVEVAHALFRGSSTRSLSTVQMTKRSVFECLPQMRIPQDSYPLFQEVAATRGRAGVSPNVKDEPRRGLARAVPFLRSFVRNNDRHSS